MSEVVSENDIRRMVDAFYAVAREDPVIGPVFKSHITEWDDHVKIVGDFWCGVVLDKRGYKGNPFGAHIKIKMKSEYFDRWLMHFKRIATETLPPAAAGKALAMAFHMGESLKHGLVDGVGNRVSLPLRKASALTADAGPTQLVRIEKPGRADVTG